VDTGPVQITAILTRYPILSLTFDNNRLYIAIKNRQVPSDAAFLKRNAFTPKCTDFRWVLAIRDAAGSSLFSLNEAEILCPSAPHQS